MKFESNYTIYVGVYVRECVLLTFVSIGASKIGLYLTFGLRGLVNFLTFKSVAHSNLMQFLWGYIAKVLIFVLKSKNSRKLNLIWFKADVVTRCVRISDRYLVKFTLICLYGTYSRSGIT